VDGSAWIDMFKGWVCHGLAVVNGVEGIVRTAAKRRIGRNSESMAPWRVYGFACFEEEREARTMICGHAVVLLCQNG
jgi:hypothetical protein